MTSPSASTAATGKAGFGATFSRDLTASIVVFLVAMPLCMGIAIASGVPAERGLITGIIGGIVVGALAGSPLQVSGPAAGLAVIVFDVVQTHGLNMLGPILLIAGLIQILAGVVRVGGWFRAISPAVVHGMLAGIGLLIVVGQFHVLFGDSPLPHGLENIMAMPGQVFGLNFTSLGAAEATLIVGLTTIVGMIGWEKIRPAKLKLVPGALIGVLAGGVVAGVFGLDVQRIIVPESIAAAIAVPGMSDLAGLADPAVIGVAIAIAFIASAETLLSAAAVDQMHDGPRTKYNKELFAQGVGNMLCGAAGALPMTGVIVRSSANVQAGAATRLSAIMHGVWILGFIVLLPWLLRMTPSAALAGVLVVTGWRLVSLKHVRHLFQRYGLFPAMIWGVTFVTVVATDLLMGVLVGLGLTVLELLPQFRKLRLRIGSKKVEDGPSEVTLEGSATFIHLPQLTKVLEATPEHGEVKLNARRLAFLDHTVAEAIQDWLKGRARAGRPVQVEAEGEVGERLKTAHA